MSNETDSPKIDPKRQSIWKTTRVVHAPSNNLTEKSSDTLPSPPNSPSSVEGQSPLSSSAESRSTISHTGGTGGANWSPSISLSSRRQSSSTSTFIPLTRNSSYTSRVGTPNPFSSLSSSTPISSDTPQPPLSPLSSQSDRPVSQPAPSPRTIESTLSEKSIMVSIDVIPLSAVRKMKLPLSTKIESVISQLVKRSPELAQNRDNLALQDPRTGVWFEESRSLSSYLLKEGSKIDAKVRSGAADQTLSVKIKVDSEEKPYSLKYSIDTKLKGLCQLLPDNKFEELDIIKYSYKGQVLLPDTPLSELCFSEDDVINISEENPLSPGAPTVKSLSLENLAPDSSKGSFHAKNLLKNPMRQSVYSPRTSAISGPIILKIQFETNPNRGLEVQAEYVNRVMSFELHKTVEECLAEIYKRFPVDPQKSYVLHIPKTAGKDRVKLKANEKIGVYNINNNDQLVLKESKKSKKEAKEKEKEKTAIEKKEKKAEKKKKIGEKKEKKEKKTIIGRITNKSSTKSTDPSTNNHNVTEASLYPEIIDKVLDYLEKNALDLEGIFRLSASAAQTKEFSRLIFAQELNFEGWESPHVVSCGLKQYFRELPQPLFPSNTYSKYIAVGKLDLEERVGELKELVQQLPEPNRTVLFSLCSLLKKTSEKSDINFMVPGNLGVVFGPTLLRSDSANTLDAMFESEYQIKVIETLITDFSEIFHDQLQEEEESGDESEEGSEKEGGDEETEEVDSASTSLSSPHALSDTKDIQVNASPRQESAQPMFKPAELHTSHIFTLPPTPPPRERKCPIIGRHVAAGHSALENKEAHAPLPTAVTTEPALVSTETVVKEADPQQSPEKNEADAIDLQPKPEEGPSRDSPAPLPLVVEESSVVPVIPVVPVVEEPIKEHTDSALVGQVDLPITTSSPQVSDSNDHSNLSLPSTQEEIAPVSDPTPAPAIDSAPELPPSLPAQFQHQQEEKLKEEEAHEFVSQTNSVEIPQGISSSSQTEHKEDENIIQQDETLQEIPALVEEPQQEQEKQESSINPSEISRESDSADIPLSQAVASPTVEPASQNSFNLSPRTKPKDGPLIKPQKKREDDDDDDDDDEYDVDGDDDNDGLRGFEDEEEPSAPVQVQEPFQPTEKDVATDDDQ
eukprot:TRINITY_DN1765_c0_g1_i2.p1 TRINITY_DN1765_c0_g1~~TRINITY_DN1765_c0_g1_i2.p1  ORF type:complete len:1136 (+),score=313.71 TRINITY_DN1765_c0_g1_i2:55-3462(+)